MYYAQSNQSQLKVQRIWRINFFKKTTKDKIKNKTENFHTFSEYPIEE